jgi:hypothetical protein
VNWAKRTKCNVCNTSKPGHNEGGVRYTLNIHHLICHAEIIFNEHRRISGLAIWSRISEDV